MKKWILAGLTISALGLSACSSNEVPKAEAGNSKAIMNSDAGSITQDELYKAMKSKYGVQMLQQLAVKKVLSNKYKVPQSDVDAQVKKTKEDLGGQFLSTLLQYGYDDEKDYRKAIELNLMEKKAVFKTLTVTDQELQAAYAAYKPDIHARHIIVGNEQTAKEITAKLANGAKFEDMAKQYSKDPGTSSKGGDLGWIGLGTLDEEFEKVAFALPLNQIGAPVKTQYGYEIIQVTDIKPKKSLEEMKSTLTDQVKQTKFTQDAIQKVLSDEFKKAKVTIPDKDLEKAAELSTFYSH